MLKSWSIAVMMLLTYFTCVCRSEIVHSVFDISGPDWLAITDGIHKKSEELPGFTKISSNGSGYRIEVQTFSHLDRIQLLTSWDSENEDSWTRVSVLEMSLNGKEIVGPPIDKFYEVMAMDFDPWIRGQTFAFHGDSVVYGPRRDQVDRIGISPCWDCFASIPGTGNYAVFEYSVEHMPTPLAADFNYDDRVDFADFLIMAKFFGFQDPTANAPMHYAGDANFDGVTNFDDYLILTESFGTSRVQAASVPEPSGFAVLVFGLSALARIRMRSNRVT